MRSCPSANGYSTKKSSAFSPVGSKYENQASIHEHMMSHYRRIENATASVDTSAPKTREIYMKNVLRKPKRRPKYTVLSVSSLNSRLATSSPLERVDLSRSHLDETLTSEQTSFREGSRQDTHDAPVHLPTTPRIVNGLVWGNKQFRQSVSMGHDGEEMKATSSGMPADYFHARHQQISPRPNSGFSILQQPLDRSQHYAMRTSPVIVEDYSMYPEFKALQKKKERLKEEERYLDFLNDITDEVIKRGIFSNRVLTHVCQGHIERRKHDLDESRMWEIVSKLKSDLNIEEDED